ncbi:MAG: DUF896 domain-containing protein [Clostridia bacterium]|nr:DUF896 domain-containing protein [Clostridia bacterium]
MDMKKIQRINELAKKAKETALTPEEQAERQVLRQEYIQSFRNNLQSTLDSVVLVDKKGNKSPLKKKTSH